MQSRPSFRAQDSPDPSHSFGCGAEATLLGTVQVRILSQKGLHGHYNKIKCISCVSVCVARKGAGRRMQSESLRWSVQGSTENEYKIFICFKNIVNEFHQVLILISWKNESLEHLLAKTHPLTLIPIAVSALSPRLLSQAPERWRLPLTMPQLSFLAVHIEISLCSTYVPAVMVTKVTTHMPTVKTNCSSFIPESSYYTWHSGPLTLPWNSAQHLCHGSSLLWFLLSVPLWAHCGLMLSALKL